MSSPREELTPYEAPWFGGQRIFPASPVPAPKLLILIGIKGLEALGVSKG